MADSACAFASAGVLLFAALGECPLHLLAHLARGRQLPEQSEPLRPPDRPALAGRRRKHGGQDGGVEELAAEVYQRVEGVRDLARP